MDPGFPMIGAADDLLDETRFELWPLGDDKASEVTAVRERTTGRTWIRKRASVGFDAVNEVLAAQVTRGLGWAWPRARFVPGRQDLVLIQHVVTYPDAGELLGDGTDYLTDDWNDLDPNRLARLAEDLVDPLEPLRVLLLSYLLDNLDGNDANWLVMSCADRPPPLKKLVPIDWGFCLLGRDLDELGAVSHDALLAERLPVRLPEFLTDWWAPLAMRRLTQVAGQLGLVSTSDLAGAYDKFVRDAHRTLAGLVFDGVDPEHARRVRRLTRARLAGLEANWSAYLLLLTDEPTT